MAAVAVDVVVPPGVAAGSTVEFEAPDGARLTATVPEGLDEGDTFRVAVEGGSAASFASIMLAFTEWFEREAVGERVDSFVTRNAHRMAATGSIESGGENSHEWWPLYLEYQAEFEVLLNDFLVEAGCSSAQFLAAANEAEGMTEIYVRAPRSTTRAPLAACPTVSPRTLPARR